MEKVGRDRGFKFYLRKAKDMYNKGLITVILLFIFIPSAFSDTLDIPYTCFPKIIQQHFADYKYKIDLSSDDRDEYSWGFLVNEGTSFKIVTYRSISDSDFILLREISVELMKKLKEAEDGENRGH